MEYNSTITDTTVVGVSPMEKPSEVSAHFLELGRKITLVEQGVDKLTAKIVAVISSDVPPDDEKEIRNTPVATCSISKELEEQTERLSKIVNSIKRLLETITL